ncbi:capsular polysaccharide biosynthesis protein [Bacillus mesophilus]|uniref:Capsular biosynthesis protein n=1 Tax=Bacillus mesophilus TaxID=1808955 RepID=A0A6M0Q7R9_9BACI|nr:Wzz/FepE/Etk N-terminal domain-containing protein [Bacillus mesophilus]MBM7661737.1 capsular polysaccharide biosynthesis protein [Bacillus mesophilus]NEY72396.1 capsular biosynthesis protein [Bacillus mesophilus]
MEETISLKELFQTLRKRLGLIAIITILAVTVSGVVSYFFLTPIYQASTQILVNQKKPLDQLYNVGELQTNVMLINTYRDIIQSPTILDKVKEQLELETIGQISVASESNSQVFSVTVQDPDPVKAVDIANTIANVFQTEIMTMFGDNVNIISKAEVAETPQPIKPQPILNMAIALVVGLMLGVGLAFLLEYLDNTIKTEQDIEKLLELPVLGAVTVITVDADKKSTSAQANKRSRGENLGA